GIAGLGAEPRGRLERRRELDACGARPGDVLVGVRVDAAGGADGPRVDVDEVIDPVREGAAAEGEALSALDHVPRDIAVHAPGRLGGEVRVALEDVAEARVVEREAELLRAGRAEALPAGDAQGERRRGPVGEGEARGDDAA